MMIPRGLDEDGAAVSRRAREFWSTEWSGRSMMAVGAQDPVMGPAVMQDLRSYLRGCAEPMVIEQGGHFVQEHGERIARAAVGYFAP
jgi:tRNA(adenine34) deaminase